MSRVPVDPRSLVPGRARDDTPDFDDFHWNDEEPHIDGDEPAGWEPWSLQGEIPW